jgi:peptidoglycan/LPS O-acetylase OafA/YrhL
MVYYAVMRFRGGIHEVSAFTYAAEVAGCLAAILLLALIIHLTVERPSMKLSEEIAGKAVPARISAS